MLIHPEDAAALALADGDAVRLGNGLGSVVVHAKPFAGVPRGVVIVEGIWPNSAFLEGIGINTLTSPEPIPPAGGAAFHDTAVWLRAA
ncbi:Biotin sulfoxide reductase [compost metagenome]